MLTTIRVAAQKWVKGHHNEVNLESEKEFGMVVARQVEIEKNLRQFQEHVEGYINSLRDTCTLQGNVSGDLLYFFDANSENRKQADQYHNVCSKMYSTQWKELSDDLKNEVLEPISAHLKLFPTVMEMVKKRKRRLQEVQSYRRQVLQLAKTAKTKNAEKFKRKSDKLNQAEALFQRIHLDLVETIESCRKISEELLLQCSYKIMEAQQSFYNKSHKETSPLRQTSAIFKKTAEEKTKQIEDRLKQMVEGFKRGEYAAEATLPAANALPTEALSPPCRSTETKIEENFLQIFDAEIPFEFLHREYAPSPEEYLHMREQRMEPSEAQAIQMATSIFSGLPDDDNTEQAVYAYRAKEDGELSFSAGDIIEVVERREDGWWLGALANNRGIFPCNYTRPFISHAKGGTSEACSAVHRGAGTNHVSSC
mmetsp:Transcript_20977/g.39359  ORF Transcript_20977/g.39359 Transcript_20977/m.39359 type:complete len:424 (-) Transcript_20977:273-1544(-)